MGLQYIVSVKESDPHNIAFNTRTGTANAEFENVVQSQVRGLRQTAEKEGKDLNADEVAAIRGLAKSVQQRRARSTTELSPESDEIATYLRENNVDIGAASSSYEAQVQQFVRGLRDKASSEGRDLTHQERQSIRLAAETVKDFRRTVAKAA